MNVRSFSLFVYTAAMVSLYAVAKTLGVTNADVIILITMLAGITSELWQIRKVLESNSKTTSPLPAPPPPFVNSWRRGI